MTGFADKNVIAELTAKMLIEVEAVRFMTDKPFIFTSGWASPVYTDCRRLISFPRVRRTLIDFGAETIERDVGFEQFDFGRRRRDRRHSICRLDGGPADAADAICAQEAEGLRPQRADRGPHRSRRPRAPGRGHDHRRPQQGQFLHRACARPAPPSSIAS